LFKFQIEKMDADIKLLLDKKEFNINQELLLLLFEKMEELKELFKEKKDNENEHTIKYIHTIPLHEASKMLGVTKIKAKQLLLSNKNCIDCYYDKADKPLTSQVIIKTVKQHLRQQNERTEASCGI